MNNALYGFHSVVSYLKTNPLQIKIIYLDNKRHDKRFQDVVTLAKTHQIAISFITSKELNSLTKNSNHQGIVAGVIPGSPAVFKEVLALLDTKNKATVLVLDGITDPQNLGAIIRSADCFGVDLIILPKNNSANIDNPVVAKVSSGAINNIDIVTVSNLSQALEVLKLHKFWIVGTALRPDAINLYDFKQSGKIAWVVGSEGIGMRRLVMEHCDFLVTIPMKGHTQSLNVSVATGVVLAHANVIRNL